MFLQGDEITSSLPDSTQNKLNGLTHLKEIILLTGATLMNDGYIEKSKHVNFNSVQSCTVENSRTYYHLLAQNVRFFNLNISVSHGSMPLKVQITDSLHFLQPTSSNIVSSHPIYIYLKGNNMLV